MISLALESFSTKTSKISLFNLWFALAKLSPCFSWVSLLLKTIRFLSCKALASFNNFTLFLLIKSNSVSKLCWILAKLSSSAFVLFIEVSIKCLFSSNFSCFDCKSRIAFSTFCNFFLHWRKFSSNSLFLWFSCLIKILYLFIWLPNFNFSSSCSSIFLFTVVLALSFNLKLNIALSKSFIRSLFFSIICWISSSASAKFTLASLVSSCWLFNWASYNNFFSVKFLTLISSISMKKSCSFFFLSWLTMFSSTLLAVVLVTLISLCTCKL